MLAPLGSWLNMTLPLWVDSVSAPGAIAPARSADNTGKVGNPRRRGRAGMDAATPFCRWSSATGLLLLIAVGCKTAEPHGSDYPEAYGQAVQKLNEARAEQRTASEGADLRTQPSTVRPQSPHYDPLPAVPPSAPYATPTGPVSPAA